MRKMRNCTRRLAWMRRFPSIRGKRKMDNVLNLLRPLQSFGKCFRGALAATFLPLGARSRLTFLVSIRLRVMIVVNAFLNIFSSRQLRDFLTGPRQLPPSTGLFAIVISTQVRHASRVPKVQLPPSCSQRHLPRHTGTNHNGSSVGCEPITDTSLTGSPSSVCDF